MPWRWCTASSTSWKISRTLDLKQLLEELSHQIAEGMGAAEHVRIEVDVPHLVVQSGVAVALALFTVEALTNIFKHAFPGQARGVIRVMLTPRPAGPAAPCHRR